MRMREEAERAGFLCGAGRQVQSLWQAVCHSRRSSAASAGDVDGWNRNRRRGDADVSDEYKGTGKTRAKAKGAGLFLFNSAGRAAATVLDFTEGGGWRKAARKNTCRRIARSAGAGGGNQAGDRRRRSPARLGF